MEFSNPAPPTNYTHQTSQDDGQPLTNDDFRKLMMTPRVGGPAPAAKTYQKQTWVDVFVLSCIHVDTFRFIFSLENNRETEI